MEKQKVLIIRMSSIGDIVVTSPVIRCVKLQSSSEIHFLVKEKFSDVISDNPYIDKLFILKNSLSVVIQELKRENYDLILDLHKNIRSSRILLSLRKPFIRYKKFNIRKLLWTKLHWNILPNKHLVDRYFDGLKKKNIINDGKGLDFFISKDHRQEAETFLSAINIENYSVLVLGAAHFTKRIPITLAQEIIELANKPIILIGGPAERKIARELECSRAFSACGQLSIGASAAILEKANVVITGDTGMMHIAAALKKPISMIWGSTHRSIGMYPYYGQKKIPVKHHSLDLKCQPCTKIGRAKCPKGHFRCMLDQQPQNIVEWLNDPESMYV